jgi:uncharacterized protein YukE
MDGFIDLDYGELRLARDTVVGCVERIEDLIQALTTLIGANLERWDSGSAAMYIDLQNKMNEKLEQLNYASAKAVAHADNAGASLADADARMARLLGNTPVGGTTVG